MAGSGPIPDKALGLYYTSKKINKRFNCTMTKVHLIICHLKFNIRKRIQWFPHCETAKFVDQKLNGTQVRSGSLNIFCHHHSHLKLAHLCFGSRGSNTAIKVRCRIRIPYDEDPQHEYVCIHKARQEAPGMVMIGNFCRWYNKFKAYSI